MVERLALVLLAACGSGKPRVVEDARKPAPSGDAAMPIDARSATATTGDVQVRIEWADVPVAARTSPGLTSCKTPRSPAVAPSTTWGIPDVLVVVEGAPPVTTEAHVRYADCALTPRIAVGTSLALDSIADRPVAIKLATRTIQLPIAGHTVTLPLASDDLVELVPDAQGAESAWVAGGAGAITDASGTVLVKDVPPGTHIVRAILPARGGHPAMKAEGTVSVVAGDLAELTLKLVP
ncbi:MAG: hypothetical protein SFX73_35025 [Kofleriaceae bacterium]|nr:hypothetical protein [Kofleriaceae bacterium]